MVRCNFLLGRLPDLRLDPRRRPPAHSRSGIPLSDFAAGAVLV